VWPAVRRSAAVLAGLLTGAIAGIAVVLCVAGLRLVVEDIYLQGFGDFVSWLGVPAVVGLVAGGVAGARLPIDRFWRSAGLVIGGLVAGAAAGAAVGAAFGSNPEAPWLGGLIGSGVGVSFATLGAVRLRGRAAGLPSALLSALLLPLTACSPAAPSEARTLPAPDRADVEAIVFLLGDPGLMQRETHPVAVRLRADIEAWSASLGAEGHVALVVLGDVLYPAGLHAADTRERERDSLRLATQISLVSGEAAEAAGARAIFLAGNHDWGHEADWAGALRLVRLGEFLDSWTGPAAGRLTMSPEPGTGGPGIVDLGRGVRLVLLDTAWWLLGADPFGKDEVIEGLREALRSAAGRRVIVAAHHPLRSAGPHGVAEELGRTFGVRFLLQKAGLLLQDLTSPPYADLRARLGEVFSDAGRPDIFAGGHEHSLQVFGLEATPVPRDLVVGSASKLTKVRNAPGLLFARSEPGYAKVFVLRDGGLHIRIEAAPARYLTCENATDLDACMADGVAAFRTVWAETLEARQELGE
jgi:hypothetical protein